MNQLTQRRSVALPAALLVALAGGAGNALGEPVSALDALTNGKFAFQFRYRFENMEQDNALDEAEASVLRSRLSYTTQAFAGWQAQVEGDNLTVIGNDDAYNSTSNGETRHSVIADPEGTELNQAWLSYSGLSHTLIKAGRQRFMLDNERFIGTAGWRQNEQTFDGVSLVNTSIRSTTLTYAHISNVNRVFGPNDGTIEAWKGDWDSDIHVFNASYAPVYHGADGFGVPLGLLTAYGYLLDFKAADPQSNQTFGLRFNGKFPLTEKVGLLYTLEYARQEDYADNPVQYDTNYYTVELGLALPHTIQLLAGNEVLGGDAHRPGQAFRTPLAALHKFQGFADVFTNTPAAGIDDRYLNAQMTLFNAVAAVSWHDYEAEDGGNSYGDELDVTLTKKFNQYFTLMLKYADYHEDGFSVDTRKWWVQAQVDF